MKQVGHCHVMGYSEGKMVACLDGACICAPGYKGNDDGHCEKEELPDTSSEEALELWTRQKDFMNLAETNSFGFTPMSPVSFAALAGVVLTLPILVGTWMYRRSKMPAEPVEEGSAPYQTLSNT